MGRREDEAIFEWKASLLWDQAIRGSIQLVKNGHSCCFTYHSDLLLVFRQRSESTWIILCYQLNCDPVRRADWNWMARRCMSETPFPFLAPFLSFRMPDNEAKPRVSERVTACLLPRLQYELYFQAREHNWRNLPLGFLISLNFSKTQVFVNLIVDVVVVSIAVQVQLMCDSQFDERRLCYATLC